MFKTMKLFAQAMKPSSVRQGLAASRESLANGGQLTPEQLAVLTPEQVAAHEEAMQHLRGGGVDQAIADQAAGRPLLGAAGEHRDGPLPDREQMTDLRLGAQLKHAWGGFSDAVGETVGGRQAPPPPAPPVSGDRDEQAAHERAQREEARTPYLAETRNPVVVTRIATDPQHAVEELCGWLGTAGLAARPDLVYGVARVPDHIPRTVGITKAAIVEWEVVHAATTALPPASPARFDVFDARTTWVARRRGEPGVLDEDLGVELFRQAGLGPEHCLGVARQLAVNASSGDEDTSAQAPIGVTGTFVLRPAGTGDGTFDRMRAAAPLPLQPAPGVHAAVLNWRAVRDVVNPRNDRRPAIPSPFPHLPLTGAELLTAYLSIVGIRPADCYSAQVTQDRVEDILGGTAGVRTTSAEREVAADGEVRRRFRGGSHVVVVHRDTPEYAAGRERWAAYERDVLQSQLHVGVELRAPVRGEAPRRGLLGRLGREDEEGRNRKLGHVPYDRYCWPPVA